MSLLRSPFFHFCRTKCACRMAVFSTLSTPRFFCWFFSIFLGVPPDFFQIFVKKNEKIDFFEKKSEKNLDFFLENFDFFDKKSEKIWIFSLEISKFLTKIWKNLGVLPTFLTKSAKKNGGTQRWKTGHPRGALGTSKVKKRRP